MQQLALCRLQLAGIGSGDTYLRDDLRPGANPRKTAVKTSECTNPSLSRCVGLSRRPSCVVLKATV